MFFSHIQNSNAIKIFILSWKIRLIHDSSEARVEFEAAVHFGSPDYYISKFVCMDEGGFAEVRENGRSHGRRIYEKTLSAPKIDDKFIFQVEGVKKSLSV